MTKDESNEDWSIPCFGDDEDVRPSPEELEKMYQLLETGAGLDLQWKCLGRRLPSPVPTDDVEEIDTSEKEMPVKNKEFDFMDEMALPTMRVRNATPKGSAKKKTANFAGVMDAMKKHSRPTNEQGTTGQGQGQQTPNRNQSSTPNAV